MSHQIDVKSLREQLGWKRDRLARYLGVDLSSVSRIENGQSRSGPVSRLLEILETATAEGRADELCPDIAEAAE